MPELKLIRNMNVGTLDAGYRRLLRLMEAEGYRVHEIIPVNFKRYYIIKGEPENIMILFKRDWFYNFVTFFRNKGATGIGDSINCDDIKTAIQHEVKRIYIIHHTGYVYTISLEEFNKKSNEFRWKNKEGKEVRSISIHEYKRIYSL